MEDVSFDDLIPDETLPKQSAPTQGTISFDDLVPKKPPAPTPEEPFADLIPQKKPVSGPMPDPLSAAFQGVMASGTDLRQTGETFVSGKPSEAGEQSPAAEDFEWRDAWDPVRGLSKVSYRVGRSAPTAVAGVIGGGLGAAAGAPFAGVGAVPGGIIGGSAGAALGTALQTIGPVFAEELKKSPKDPDAAWDNALKHSAVSSLFSAAGWAAFPLKAFNGPIKNLVFQAAGIQPGISVGEKATQNIIAGKPVTERLANAYIEGAVGTAVPAIGHKILEGPKAPVAPPQSPVQAQLLQSSEYKNQLAEQTHVLANNTPNTDQALQYRKQAQSLEQEAAHERFLGNVPPPEARPSGFRGKVEASWVKNFQPELFSDKALLADARVAKYKSSRAQAEDSIMARADEHRYEWNKVPEADVRTFLEAYETSPGNWSPDLRNRITDVEQRFPFTKNDAPLMKKWLNDSYNREIDSGSRADFIQNYFPHIWKTPVEQVQKVYNNAIQGMGPTWFQKARYYDLIEYGIQNGLELKSKNPVDLVTMRLLSGADMQQKMNLLKDFHGEGLAVPKTEAPNWIMSPNRTGALPWQEVSAPNGTKWMLAPDAQALWKNGVEAKGLWARDDLVGDSFRGWMALKSAWVPIKLGLSMFHPVHVLHISMWNNLNRGFHEALGKGSQTAWDRLKAVPKAAIDTLADPILAYPWGVPFTNIKVPARTFVGKEIAEAWRAPVDKQTARQSQITGIMNEAGVSAQLSEQLRTSGVRQFRDAVQNGDWKGATLGTLSSPVPGLRIAIGSLAKPIFEHWIPNLKAAAVMRETESLYRRRPDIMNDPAKRSLAMRAVGKQIDNRFGEMFYGSLFWNRNIKDAAIGSFLSLGWNLGFAREFVGGVLEPAARRFMAAPTPNRQVIRDVTTKASNAFGYAFTAMLFNSVMNWSFTGEYPQDVWDMIFPRIGGLNPDGSPRRVTNAFYTREIPMVAKHIEDEQSIKMGVLATVKNKLMFGPFIEMLSNKNYFGNQIWDESAPYFKQWQQALSNLFSEQLNPMSVAGAKRALQLSGKPFTFKDVLTGAVSRDRDVLMPLMGFGPAPAYASRDAIQNRISHTYRKYAAPSDRPFKEAEKMKERGDATIAYKQAVLSKDSKKISEAAQALAKLGMATDRIKKIQPGMELKNMFQQIGIRTPSKQISLLKDMSPEQFRFYYPVANRLKVKSDPDIRELARRYYAR